jgi:dTDP-4-amino-4,6-dideoxygalactose transaminase
MGIQVLNYLDEIIGTRTRITELYRTRLCGVPGIRLAPPLPADTQYNYAYLPIEVDEQEFGMSRDSLYEKLKEWNVFTRRYFYPLICDYPCYRSIPVNGSLAVARRVAARIMTLPIYHDLELSAVDTICSIIRQVQQAAPGKHRTVPGYDGPFQDRLPSGTVPLQV